MHSIDIDHERRLCQLLELALEHPPAEQRAYLESVCNDLALIEETLELIATEDELDDFLLTPPVKLFDLIPTSDVRDLLQGSGSTPPTHDASTPDTRAVQSPRAFTEPTHRETH